MINEYNMEIDSFLKDLFFMYKSIYQSDKLTLEEKQVKAENVIYSSIIGAEKVDERVVPEENIMWFYKKNREFDSDNEKLTENLRMRFYRGASVKEKEIKPIFYYDENRGYFYDRNYSNNLYAKMYISIKKENYLEIVDLLIEKIKNYEKEKQQLLGQTKFRDSAVNDAIVFRFANLEQLVDFIYDISTDKRVQECLDKPNLFVPNINGAGVIIDDNSSYNDFVRKMIINYFRYCVKNNVDASVKNFIIFLTYDYSSLKKEIEYQFKNILVSKLQNQDDMIIISEMFNQKVDTLSFVKTKRRKKEEE